MKLRIVPKEAYDGCIPVTVYMVQKRSLSIRQMGKHKRFFQQAKGSSINVAVV